MLSPDPKSPSLVRRRPRLTLALGVLAAIAATALLRYVTLDAVKLGATPVTQAAMSADAAPWIGASKPDVMVVVFTDYQCPICKATDPALKRLLAEDPGVRVVFRHWPIFGPVSDRAARLAIAADKQGKYADFHWALMDNHSPLTSQRIEEIAVASGLDWPRLQRDAEADSARITDQLRRNVRMAWSLGVRGTPAYLVGPLLIHGGLDDHHLRAAVSQARREQRRESEAGT